MSESMSKSGIWRTVHVAVASAISALVMPLLALTVAFLGDEWYEAGFEDVEFWVMAVIVVVAVGIFAYLFPAERYTPTPRASRIAAVAAAAAGGFAGVMTSTAEHFGIALFLMMTALIAGGFLYEMLREKRENLIRSLSFIIFMGTLGLVCSGWMTTSLAVDYLLPHPRITVAAAIFVVLGVVAISACVALWSRDAQTETEKDSAVKSEAGEDSEGVVYASPVWGYSGVAALLSGIFPLVIVLMFGVWESL
ncbi:hypothetical protein ALMA_0340 [Alloscardovia macacae]|uniref:Uncharacterized protein n=2 Tax=Alloscardovia macacae TaxID=1160091 RepID=A0A261F7I1_9BIFI|nr:hypothetical protein ALMA_0340 [Alloscardovia macacae]